MNSIRRCTFHLTNSTETVGRASVALGILLFLVVFRQKAWQLCLQRKTKYPRCKNGPFMELLPSGMANFGPTSRKFRGGITLSSIAGYRVEWLQHVIRRHEGGAWKILNCNKRSGCHKISYFHSTYWPLFRVYVLVNITLEYLTCRMPIVYSLDSR